MKLSLSSGQASFDLINNLDGESEETEDPMSPWQSLELAHLRSEFEVFAENNRRLS